jgi:iron complex outermembrane receptor protein
MFKVPVIAAAVSLVLAPAALAQSNTDYIEEVIVTAERVEKSILDVTTTTNVLSEAFLERENIRELNQVANFIPNMLVQEQAVGGQSFTIRGIGNEDGEQKLGSFFNGMNVTDRNFSGQFLHDIERVEVLKGPQPTAFGSFAVNGAVNIVSNTARFDEQEFEIGAGLGSFNEYRINGVANLPLTDWLAFRLAAFSVDKDGYSENVSGEDQNARVGSNLRFTTSVQTDRFRADLIIAHEDNDGPGIGFNSKYYRTDGDIADAGSDLDFGPTETVINREITLYQLKTQFDVTANLSLAYNAYYNEGDLYEYFDVDGAAIQLDERDYNYESSQTGQELFINWNSDRVDARIGYNFFDYDSHYTSYTLYTNFQTYIAREIANAVIVQPTGYTNLSDDNIYPADYPLQVLRQQTAQYVLNNPATVNPASGQPVANALTTLVDFTGGIPQNKNETRGLFASADVRVTDELTFNVGVRDEETEANGNPDDTSDPLWKLGANYSINDELSVYYTFAQGRTPPLNAIIVNPDVERETVDSNDIGFYWVSSSFQLQGAYFTFDYENLVVSVTDSQTGLTTTANAETTSVSGFELQGEFTINEMFGVYGSFGSNDAEYGATTDGGFVANYAGNQFRYSPEYTYTLGGLMQWNDLRAVLSWTYMDDVYFEPSNDPDTLQEGFGLLNLSLEYQFNEAIQLGIYGKNILDEDYLIDSGNFGGSDGQPTLIQGTPANWLATIQYRF